MGAASRPTPAPRYSSTPCPAQTRPPPAQREAAGGGGERLVSCRAGGERNRAACGVPHAAASRWGPPALPCARLPNVDGGVQALPHVHANVGAQDLQGWGRGAGPGGAQQRSGRQHEGSGARARHRSSPKHAAVQPSATQHTTTTPRLPAWKSPVSVSSSTSLTAAPAGREVGTGQGGRSHVLSPLPLPQRCPLVPQPSRRGATHRPPARPAHCHP